MNVRLREHSDTTRLILSAVGEHLTDTGYKLEEKKAAVIATEEDNFRRKIREASEILCQSPSLSRDRGFELPGLYGEDFTRDK